MDREAKKGLKKKKGDRKNPKTTEKEQFCSAGKTDKDRCGGFRCRYLKVRAPCDDYSTCHIDLSKERDATRGSCTKTGIYSILTV